MQLNRASVVSRPQLSQHRMVLRQPLHLACQLRQEAHQPSRPECTSNASRRDLLHTLVATTLLASGSSFVNPKRALAFTPPPPGYRVQVDKLDGYTFFYPESWIAVTSSGNDCFLRNPRNIEENLFVDLSSPSSSRYESVTDLGTAEEAAARILDQYLEKEFMSTRIGIRREGKIVSAAVREGKDGRTYYDVAVQMTSYASRNPYVATQSEVLREYGVEWERVLFTTLGVANKRLYELRLQSSADSLNPEVFNKITTSFTLQDVEIV